MLTAHPPLGAPRVLLIEDDPDQAALVTRWLNAAGMWVRTAYDAATGLDFVAQPYDMVLCDMNLPCGEGVSVVAESKRRFPSRPAVLMTAHDSKHYARLAARSDPLGRCLPIPAGTPGPLPRAWRPR